MSDRVTLWRVKRPDGTVLKSPPAPHPETALKYAWKNDGYDRDWLRIIAHAPKGRTAMSMAEETGYVVEPVEYAPVDPEREAVIWKMREAFDEARDNILYGRRQLEAPCLDSYQTNAVLDCLDECFGPALDDAERLGIGEAKP